MSTQDYLNKNLNSNIYNHIKKSIEDDSDYNTRFTEFLKFIYIASIGGPSFIPVNKDIDVIWHEFILQTREYENFCMSLPGKRFIHHESNSLEEYAKKNDKNIVVQKMLRWLPLYYKYFGEFNNCSHKYWTMVVFLKNEMDMSLEQINQLAKNESI